MAGLGARVQELGCPGCLTTQTRTVETAEDKKTTSKGESAFSSYRQTGPWRRARGKVRAYY